MKSEELDQLVESLVRQARPDVEKILRAKFRCMLEDGEWVVVNNTLMTGKEALAKFKKEVA